MNNMQKLLAQIRNGTEFKTALTDITGLAMNKFEGDFRMYAQEIAIFYGHAFDWTQHGSQHTPLAIKHSLLT